MSDSIESILKSRQSTEEDFFYKVARIDGVEHYLEFRFRNGVRTAFALGDLVWINFDPDDGVSMSFGTAIVEVKGRGLYPTLFDALKQKKVLWVREADTEMEDNASHALFIGDLFVIPADEFGKETETN